MTVVTSNIQLGTSGTPANNFVITAEAANGTMKLARGNAGATTQDIFTVDASGNITPIGNILGGVLGTGQTDQDLTASRVAGTTYTNTTGKPILVEVLFSSTSSGQVGITPTVDGVSRGGTIYPVSAAGFILSRTFLVPAGKTYSVSTSGSSATPGLSKWIETR